MKLSENFSLEEFCFSLTANEKKIANVATPEIIESLKFTAAGLERIRKALGDRPIRVTSAFRCEELNRAVGGVKTSQHVRGEAADFVCPAFGTPKEIVFALSHALPELGIDQIICEGTWVHVSFTKNPRHVVLTLTKKGFVKGAV